MDKEIKAKFLFGGTKQTRVEKNALWRNLSSLVQKEETIKPHDAIKLASSLNGISQQPIRREEQLRVSKQEREKQTPANCISFVCQNNSNQFHSINSEIPSQKKANMANNQTNSQPPSVICHRANTKPVFDGDTDSVVETSRADLLHEIKIVESELLHLKKKSHLVYMGGQWRPCKRKRNWDDQIVQKHLRLEKLYDSLEQLREPKPVKSVPKMHSNAVLKYNWAHLPTIGDPTEIPEPEAEARWDMIKFIAAKTDIHYNKWLKEQNEDPEMCLARQSVLASDKHALPPWLRKNFDDLNVKMGLLFCKEQLLVPASLEEWVLQVLHGDHAGQTKMVDLAKNLIWKSKQLDIEEKTSNCLICFKAGKNLKPVIANSKVNRDIPKPTKPAEELQMDFAGPFFDELGHKKFVVLAVDGFSRWPSAKLAKGCKTKDVLKFLDQYCLDNGQPKVIKSDMGPAFTAKEFKKFYKSKGIRNEFSTPYLHTPIGLVERHIQTFHKYMKTFLVENNKMELAVKRTHKVMRYTKHQSIGMSPFEQHFGRKHNSELTELLCLENPGKFIMEHVDLDGFEVWDNTWKDSEIKSFEKDRSYRRRRPVDELQDFVKKHKNVSQKFYVHKNPKKKGLDSDYLTKQFQAESETKHTVTVGDKTFHKKAVSGRY